MAQGIIKRYDFRKGFGFIADDKSGEDFFFHKSQWQGSNPIRKGMSVQFIGKDSEKGPQAETVIPLANGGKSTPANNKPAAKSVSLEERVVSLESSIVTLKVISCLALAGVIILAATSLEFI